jgi:hypothetical protein
LLALLVIVPGVLVLATGAAQIHSDVPSIEITKVFYCVDATEHLDRKAAFMERFEEVFGVRHCPHPGVRDLSEGRKITGRPGH